MFSRPRGPSLHRQEVQDASRRLREDKAFGGQGYHRQRAKPAPHLRVEKLNP